MDMSNLNSSFASVIFGKIDTDRLADALNAATLNDVSNLGLNEDEQIAYDNIMSSRKVEKKLEGPSIGFGINYDAVNDPGEYLSVLTQGQEAPEITGTVHLPQGGTRPTNVKFWHRGQVYEEGTKDPVVFPENDNAMLATFARDEVNTQASDSHEELGAIIRPALIEEINQIGGGHL